MERTNKYRVRYGFIRVQDGTKEGRTVHLGEEVILPEEVGNGYGDAVELVEAGATAVAVPTKKPASKEPKESMNKGKKQQRLVGYIRVSTDEQASSGLSLESQTERIKKYADLYEHTLVGLYSDVASARDLERPGLQKAFEKMKAADGLIVVSLDRLTRTIADAAKLLEGEFKKKRLISINENVDTTSAAGQLMYNVVLAFAQWERQSISERTVIALAQKRKRGELTGMAPFGFMAEVEDGVKVLKKHPREFETLQFMIKLRAGGATFREIASLLVEGKHLNRRGEYRNWTDRQVRNMLVIAEKYTHLM